jgi:hypothetical protein
MLAEKAGMPLAVLEQIEEGRLNFLSHTQRSRLARVLKITPREIRATEIAPPIYQPHDVKLESISGEAIAHFNNGKRLPLREMERNPEGFWPCPACGAGLRTHSSVREDLQHFSWLAYRVRCVECLFKLDFEENLSAS